jgi:hypothetical protein
MKRRGGEGKEIERGGEGEEKRGGERVWWSTLAIPALKRLSQGVL